MVSGFGCNLVCFVGWRGIGLGSSGGGWRRGIGGGKKKGQTREGEGLDVLVEEKGLAHVLDFGKGAF